MKDERLPTFEYRDGKVLGGQLAEEAKFEVLVATKLDEAWRIEFPGQPSPFRKPLSCIEFDAYVVSRDDPGNRQIRRLAETMWGSAETSRLDAFVGSLVPPGQTEREYALGFAKTLAEAVMVMHKRLRGTFSSPRGTSISFGNVTPSGYVYDYETAQLPRPDKPGALIPHQLQDLYGVFELVAAVVYEIDRWPLVDEGYSAVHRYYTQSTHMPASFAKMVDQVKSISSASDFPRVTVQKMADALIATRTWK